MSRRDPDHVVRSAAFGAILDPEGFATALGRRLSWERMRGRSEGLGLAVVAVAVSGWLWGLDAGALTFVLGVGMVTAYVAALVIGKRPR